MPASAVCETRPRVSIHTRLRPPDDSAPADWSRVNPLKKSSFFSASSGEAQEA
jgi:hypothetical protein